MLEGITITEMDRSRLKRLIGDKWLESAAKDSALQALEREIDRARVVASNRLPGDVVSMNTRALLRLNGREVEAALVYPQDADWSGRHISILSPIGTAILGCRVGDSIKWSVPSGVTVIEIGPILYQPEAAGDYHL